MSKLMTIREVSKTGIAKEGLLRRWLKDGKLPGMWEGNRFYVNVPQLEAWIEKECAMNGDING